MSPFPHLFRLYVGRFRAGVRLSFFLFFSLPYNVSLTPRQLIPFLLLIINIRVPRGLPPRGLY